MHLLICGPTLTERRYKKRKRPSPGIRTRTDRLATLHFCDLLPRDQIIPRLTRPCDLALVAIDENFRRQTPRIVVRGHDKSVSTRTEQGETVTRGHLDLVERDGRAARVESILSNSFGFGGQNAALVVGHVEAHGG